MLSKRKGSLPMLSLLGALLVSILFFSFIIFQMVLLDTTQLEDEKLQAQLITRSLNSCFSSTPGVINASRYTSEDLNNCINEEFLNKDQNPLYFRIYLQELDSVDLNESKTEMLYPHNTEQTFLETRELCSTVDADSCRQRQLSYPFRYHGEDKDGLVTLHFQILQP